MVILSCLTTVLLAQTADSVASVSRQDTGFLDRLRRVAREQHRGSVEKYKSNLIARQQEKTRQEIRATYERAKIFLRKDLDTTAYRKDLIDTRARLTILQDGIFINQGSGHTTRNLDVTASVLNELLLKLTEGRSNLNRHVNTLTGFVDRIDSLSADTTLFNFPYDSAETVRYLRKMVLMAKELGPVDSAIKKWVPSLQQLQGDMDLLVFDIRSRLEEVEQFRKQQIAQTFDKEFPFIWQSTRYHRPVSEIIAMSVAKEKMAIGFYLRDYQGRLLILVLLVFAAWYFIHSLKQKWVAEKGIDPQYHGQLVLRYPFLSALIIVLSIFQFIFLQAPFIFSFCCWLVSAVALAVLFHHYITPFWMRFWVTMIGFFVLAGSTNMILQASRPERWWLLLLSLAGAGYGLYVLRSRKQVELREKKILYFIGFVVIMELAAAIFNIAGRYNLAKTLLISGFAGLIVAILFLWTVRLINEGLGLIATIYRHPDRKLFYIDFDRVGESVPGFFYVFLVIGWFVLVSRNFYAVRQAATPFMEFLNTERTMGSYTFTINSLFIFVLIIAVSTILSQIISFFAGEPGDQRHKDKKARRPGVGSWLLLIRIFILSLGLFLAFAAAGIPLDKLAIVLGALGVGIGLGLQGLVSNLVSGLIIAFEKPVNVGDIIEVNGKLGTMKTIGFRSSVITLTEGACLIIPNGDLLSNHLVNWTMNGNKRRINIVISVAYGTNLKKAKTILEEVMAGHEKVMKYPEPVISVKGFEDSAISFDCYFWVANIREFLQLRSEVITAIDEAFQCEGIIIPFPQQDIHIINEKNERTPPA